MMPVRLIDPDGVAITTRGPVTFGPPTGKTVPVVPGDVVVLGPAAPAVNPYDYCPRCGDRWDRDNRGDTLCWDLFLAGAPLPPSRRSQTAADRFPG